MAYVVIKILFIALKSDREMLLLRWLVAAARIYMPPYHRAIFKTLSIGVVDICI